MYHNIYMYYTFYKLIISIILNLFGQGSKINASIISNEVALSQNLNNIDY